MKAEAVGFLTYFLLITLMPSSQELQHVSSVTNIEVPVRVYKGNAFVEDLGINDFEVFENGVPQKIEAVYLIKKAKIERQEERQKFAPKTGRDFYFFFELTEYTPKIKDALQYFFDNVLAPNDTLTLITPLKTYRLKSESFSRLSNEGILKQALGHLRKDIILGTAEYHNVVQDLASAAKALASGMSEMVSEQGVDIVSGDLLASHLMDRSLEEKIEVYSNLLERLEMLRSVDEAKFLRVADYLKSKEGAKHVFIFYQREYVPKIDPRVVDLYVSLNQDRIDIAQNVLGLFELHKRDPGINLDRIKQAYADSSISTHFLFLTTPAENVRGVKMEDQSEDVFSVFLEMARASGGSALSSANADFLMRRASEASENYYLLYYSPKDYSPDGKFRTISVKVKTGNYSVSHRAGYIAD